MGHGVNIADGHGFLYFFKHGRISVAQDDGAEAQTIIDIFIVILVPDVGAFTFFQYQGFVVAPVTVIGCDP